MNLVKGIMKKSVMILVVFTLFFLINTKQVLATSTEVPQSSSTTYQISLNSTQISRAIGTNYQLSVINQESISGSFNQTWTSYNPGIASVDEKGVVTAIAEGNTTIVDTITMSNGTVITLNCAFYVSNPILETTSYHLQSGSVLDINILGTNDSSQKVLTASNDCVVINELSQVYGNTTGKADISIDVDGRVLTCNVIVSNVSLVNSSAYLSKGKSTTILVQGQSQLTNIVYSSSNSSVATVSENGKIKAKKLGNVMISVSVDNTVLNFYVGVTYKNAIKVVNRAVKALGTPYSQARRMSKGYYDCSSLVWRCYSPYKVYFGSKKWAPTAAGEAQYMVRKKKSVALTGVDESKLLVGDVLFFSKGYNGRYKNIYHTGIYIGNGQMIHANGIKVSYGTYQLYKSKVSVIARPLK